MWAEWAYTLDTGRDRTLTRRATRAYDVIVAAAAQLELANARFNEFTASASEGNLIQVFDGAGHLRFPRRSLAPPDFPWPERSAAPGDTMRNVTFHGRLYRVLQRRTTLAGEPLLIAVGGQLEDNRQMLAQFTRWLLGAIPILLAATALAGYFLMRRAMEPVNRLTASVRSLSIGNLSERLPISHTGDELESLAETCNEMLARLETAVAQIKRFTADASHELRSPLSFIRTVSEYALRDPKLQPESREWFEQIFAECDEATRLLENMLLLARADAGHVDLPFETVDFSSVVEDCLDRGRMAAEAKGQRLTSRCSSEPIEIRGDRSSLRRLVWTLLDNAIKYTPAGGRIDVLLERTGAEARFRVSDNGIGIPEHLKPHVFDRFFRADMARTQEGAGLGLAIAKWIANVHRADLSVESVEGEGSVFAIVLPLACETNGS
jgi:signal transduction histidine kinase